MDVEVLTEVLRRLLHVGPPVQRHRENNHIRLQKMDTVAVKNAFGKASDECCICLGVYTDPVQLKCNHVLCMTCLESLVALSRSRCPHCRDPFNNPLVVHRPYFSGQKREETGNIHTVAPAIDNSGDESKIDSLMHDKKAFAKVLVGTVASCSTPKMVAFRAYLHNYMSEKKVTDRLVVFVKRNATAVSYSEIITDLGLSFRTAGACSTARKQSVLNIEEFRGGKIDVLMLNFKYAAGFDLVNASHLLVMDFDLSVASLTQAQGRVTRVGQKNTVVKLTVCLMRGCLDEFLYRRSIVSSKPVLNFRQDIIAELEFVCTRHCTGSPAAKMVKVIERCMESIVEMPLIIEDASAGKLTFTSRREVIYQDTFNNHVVMLRFTPTQEDTWCFNFRVGHSYYNMRQCLSQLLTPADRTVPTLRSLIS